MSLVPLATHRTPDTSLYAALGAGGGGGGGGGSFSTINVSTIDLQANGDVNGTGSINLNIVGAGSWSLVSTTSALDGTTAATAQVMSSSDNTKLWEFVLPNDGKAYVSTSAASISYLNPIIHNFGGGSLAQVSTLSVSSINGSSYPPVATQQAVTISPNNILTYIRGSSDAVLFTLPSQTAQHSYRIEFPVKIQGWNATDGLTPSYAPAAQDFISFYPQGNVVGSPAPVFTTLQMAQISSINNDWEGVVSGVWKTTATGAQTIQAATTLSAPYSTSVEIGSFGYVTDLGAI